MGISDKRMCTKLHRQALEHQSKNVLDTFFRFPKTANYSFVKHVIDDLAVPVLVFKSPARILFANTSGEEFLARVRGGPQKVQSISLPKHLQTIKPIIASCLKLATYAFVMQLRMEGSGPNNGSVGFFPGLITGRRVCVAVFFRQTPRDPVASRILRDLLESFGICAYVLDEKLRGLGCNGEFLKAFNLGEEEVIGIKLSERIKSEQASVLERQAEFALRMGRSIDLEAYALPTTRRGITFASVRGWPLCGGKSGVRGCVALLSLLPRAEHQVDAKVLDLLAKVAFEKGLPTFLTHFDGNVITMNEPGRDVVGQANPSGVNLLRDIAWDDVSRVRHLYRELARGAEFATAQVSATTHKGRRDFRVTAHPLSIIGDIGAYVALQIHDLTEFFEVKRLLASTTRSLAEEREILAKAMADLDVGYVVVGEDGTIVRVSESILRRFGLQADRLVGKKLDEWTKLSVASDLMSMFERVIGDDETITVPTVAYPLPTSDEPVYITLKLYPIVLDGRKACLIVIESLTDIVRAKKQLECERERLRLITNAIDEGVSVIDGSGRILEVNDVLLRAVAKTKHEVIGKREDEIFAAAVEEPEILVAYRAEAIARAKPVRTGPLYLSSKIRHSIRHIDITYLPIVSDSQVSSLIQIVRFHKADDVPKDERRGYVRQIETMLNKRTKELSGLNEQLQEALSRLALVAQSGIAFRSLRGMEALTNYFVEEAKRILVADFVSLLVTDPDGGLENSSYVYRGTPPPSGQIPSDVFESTVAGLGIGGGIEKKLRQIRPNMLLAQIHLGASGGLLTVWRKSGSFDSLDCSLCELLVAQLEVSIPLGRYVGEIRVERRQWEAFGRLALRIAQAPSRSSATAIVADEVSTYLGAERCFVVFSSGRGLWIRPIDGSNPERCYPVLRTHGVHADALRDFLSRALANGFCERRWTKRERRVSTCRFRDRRFLDLVSERAAATLGDLDFEKRMGTWFMAVPFAINGSGWSALVVELPQSKVVSADEICFTCLAAGAAGAIQGSSLAAWKMRELEVASETLGEVAHDLKYPVVRIKDVLARLSAHKDGQPPQKLLKDTFEEVETLRHLVDELVEIANPTRHKPEIVDAKDVVTECLDVIVPDAKRRRIEMACSSRDDLPPVSINRRDLKKVLMNLLANSLVAVGEEGSIHIELRCDRRFGTDFVKLLVKDSGPGVPKEMRSKIFDAFFSTTGGSGLGLFSARKRMRLFGGDLTCEEERDGTTSFAVWIPIVMG